MDNPVVPAPTGTPVAFQLTFDINKSGNGTTPYTVPTGQNLIMENVSGTCSSSDGHVTGLNIGIADPSAVFAVKTHRIFLAPFPEASSTVETVFNIQTKAPASAGDKVSLFVSEAGGGANESFTCIVEVYGTLLAAQ